MTHAELVKHAARWLTGSRHCGVVLAEITSTAKENPDAIGWQAHKSTLVECKVSRGDFFAQQNKPCVRTNCLIGNERYYLCERNVIRPEDVEGTDFGLLWLFGNRITIRVPAKFRSLTPLELMDERTMLVSALRRVRMREFLVVVPEIEELVPEVEVEL